MGEDTFWMGQKERDRLKVLHEAKRGKLTQKQAAEQVKVSERQLRRVLKRFRADGDRAVIHGLRGRASNRKIAAEVEQKAMVELQKPECRDFGPTYAAEYLGKLGIAAGKDTVRKWMLTAGLWKARRRRVEEVHQWRERRACCGELVQWDTSVHDWLEGRGDTMHLVGMIDDATSRMFARFVRHDSTEENLRVLWAYLERYGRPLEFYTDKAAMFETTPKRADTADSAASPAQTQITRALAELGIARRSAHSPQAKGRVERCFATAQDRLVKGLRLAAASTLEQANAYLESEYLPEWNARWTVEPANAVDAHRPLTELHDLVASLSHVEQRTVTNDYTFQFRAQRYQIARESVIGGMRGQSLRVEARLDGSVAARYEGRYVVIAACGPKPATPPQRSTAPVRKDHNRGGRSQWMKDFHLNDRRPVHESQCESQLIKAS